MKKIISLTLLVSALTFLPALPQRVATATCTDNDGDGGTTCGVTINGIRYYDCDDADPGINDCEQRKRQEPLLNYPEECSYSYMEVTRYYCPWGGGAPPDSSCTFISYDQYLISETCP